MISNFKNVEWGDLDDIVTRECNQRNKVSYFAGPIFRSTDPFFNELTSFVPVSERQESVLDWTKQPNLFRFGVQVDLDLWIDGKQESSQ